MTLKQKIRKHHGLKSDDRVGVRGSLSPFDPAGSDGFYFATVNTAAIDGDDEVVIPSGARVDERKQPVYFWQAKSIYLNHDYEILPIGAARSLRLRSEWRMQFYVTDGTQAGRDVRVCIDEGIIRGTSIGFIAEEYGPPTDEEVAVYGPAGNIIRKWKWLETSVTPMPCNIEALIDTPDPVKVELSDEAAKSLETVVGKGWVSRATAEVLGWKPARKTLVIPRAKTVVIPREM